MDLFSIFVTLSILAVFAVSCCASVRLPGSLGDHMVLQQQTDVTLWGWAFAGETVDVQTSWGATAQAVTDAKGDWCVRVKTPAAQPLSQGLHPEHITFTVPQENSVQIKDVLIGQVWLCSGQSNMDMLMRPGYPPGWNAWYGEKFWNEESRKPDRSGLRIFDVVRTAAATPQTDCRGLLPSAVLQPTDAHGAIPDQLPGWQPCTQATRPYFPAVAYLSAAEGLLRRNSGKRMRLRWCCRIPARRCRST